jgi:CII-binding regulator of phage lambda lysogenization HflD
MEIKLTLTVEEVNTILASLGKHPFDQIAALIQKIKVQGEPQVVAQTPAEPAAE